MGIEVSGGGVGDMLWKGANTLLGAAGTAMGATALGVKANASHFNRCGENWGSYNDCGCGGHGHYGYGNTYLSTDGVGTTKTGTNYKAYGRGLRCRLY